MFKMMAVRRIAQVLFLLGVSTLHVMFGSFGPLQQFSNSDDHYAPPPAMEHGARAPSAQAPGSPVGAVSSTKTLTANTAQNISDPLPDDATSAVSAMLAKMNAVPTSESHQAYLAQLKNNSHLLPIDESVMARPDEIFTFNATTASAPTCDPITAEEVGFTMAVHMSYNRIHLMRRHCDRWSNRPMSVAVGTHFSLQETVQNLTDLGCDMTDLVVNVVNYLEHQDSYPVNTLRNMAMAGVKTTHLILLDVDFVPSIDLHEHLMKHRQALTDPKQTIVIPAFEVGLSDFIDVADDFHIPKTKKALFKRFGFPGKWKENGRPKYIEQYFFNSQTNPAGHNSTNYTHWKQQPSEDLWPINCVASPRYEPYLALRYCRDLPPYQESFTGYGKNKITWILQFMRSGYKLSQLGEAYVMHVPHAASADKGKWRNTVDGVGRESLLVEQIANAFYKWLYESIPDQTAVDECPPSTAPKIPWNPQVKKQRTAARKIERQKREQEDVETN